MRGKIIPEGSIPADSMLDGNFDRMALENRNLYKLIESIQNKKISFPNVKVLSRLYKNVQMVCYSLFSTPKVLL